MKYNVYAMRDELQDDFGTPIIDVNDDTAKRNFRYGIASSKDVRLFAPYDFALYRIGSYDSATGVIESEPAVLIDRGVKRD